MAKTKKKTKAVKKTKKTTPKIPVTNLVTCR